MSQQLAVTEQRAILPGMLEGMGHKIRSVVNASGQVKKVVSITIVAANDTAYSLGINGAVLNYTSDSDATIPEIRDGLIKAAREHPTLGDSVAVNPSGNLILFTSRVAGLDFAVDDADTNLTAAVVTAASPLLTIPFGYGVASDGVGSDGRTMKVKIPDGTSQPCVGVITREHTDWDPLSGTEEGLSPGHMGSLVHEGLVAVVVEEVVADGDPVFMVVQNGNEGQFRNDVDTADAEAVAGAEFRGMLADGIALLSLNKA